MGDDQDLSTYWYRFEQEGYSGVEDDRILWIERTTEPCEVGFNLVQGQSCPLSESEVLLKNRKNFLQIAQQIFSYRMDCWQNGRAEIVPPTASSD